MRETIHQADLLPGAPPMRRRAKRALMPKVAAMLFSAGATLGLVAFAVFQPPEGNTAALLTTAACAYLVAAILWFAGRWVTPRVYPVFGIVGTVLISSTIYFWGNATNVYVLYYLWVVLYTCYFFSRGQAAVQLGVVALAYAFVLNQRPPEGNAVEAWLISIGTLSVAGLIVVSLRERVDRLVRQLSEAARRDDLTDLVNRRGFHDMLDEQIERSLRSNEPLSLIVGDLDRFKELNDRFGHQVGDQLLIGLSAFFQSAALGVCEPARIGGEEFALLLPGEACDAAYEVAEKLRGEIEETYRDQPVPLTISFGIASVPDQGSTPRELLRAADQALFAAKALGRNRSIIHSDEIAATVGGAAHDAQHEVRLATVLALAEALDVRDTGTSKHSQTVGQYAEMIARELQLDPETVERVRLAGVLHDVGKVGVPDSVLRKPGPLTADEWDVMKKHPEIGARILEGADLEDIRDWVLMHQERPDGRGYPHQLKGEEIPLPARILAVADAYEAMTADRVYREAMTHRQAQSELAACSPAQFDSLVVDAFLRAFERQAAGRSARAA